LNEQGCQIWWTNAKYFYQNLSRTQQLKSWGRKFAWNYWWTLEKGLHYRIHYILRNYHVGYKDKIQYLFLTNYSIKWVLERVQPIQTLSSLCNRFHSIMLKLCKNKSISNIFESALIIHNYYSVFVTRGFDAKAPHYKAHSNLKHYIRFSIYLIITLLGLSWVASQNASVELTGSYVLDLCLNFTIFGSFIANISIQIKFFLYRFRFWKIIEKFHQSDSMVII
jgi:hypothetical protein